MPRDIPVGNGSMLVTFDSEYQIRDIYYPYVGSENHTIGHPCRMGIWVDGHYSWVDSEWQKTLTYKTDTLVTDVKAKNDRLKIELQMYDTVDFHLNIFVKEIIIRNLDGKDREIRLFFIMIFIFMAMRSVTRRIMTRIPCQLFIINPSVIF
ncbi:hypothetical protein [Candidatus Kuenenia stuttgartiensis]|uniref:hypothetical protein n=1 Tax=Kuenenia stuttgartiensis TaxID=174633 RepID=UPI00146F8724|nr:hypothetical protein [Candidatus Kuenenia stuttgartiensis]